MVRRWVLRSKSVDHSVSCAHIEWTQITQTLQWPQLFSNTVRLFIVTLWQKKLHIASFSAWLPFYHKQLIVKDLAATAVPVPLTGRWLWYISTLLSFRYYLSSCPIQNMPVLLLLQLLPHFFSFHDVWIYSICSAISYSPYQHTQLPLLYYHSALLLIILICAPQHPCRFR